jgi:hypothetical protein
VSIAFCAFWAMTFQAREEEERPRNDREGKRIRTSRLSSAPRGAGLGETATRDTSTVAMSTSRAVD